jgi:hypothetical protein
MPIEYLVLQADPETGPFVGVSAHKLNQSQRDGRALAKLVHRSGDRVLRPTSSK